MPPAYLAKLERMFDYLMLSMQPTRRTPPLNDSGAGDVTRWMERGARLFPARADFRWFATGGREGAPPASGSHVFPYDAGDARADGLTVRTAGAGPSLAIRAFGAGGVEVVTGQKEPVVQGWLPGGGGYGGIRPIPTAIFHTTSAVPATVCYVLHPGPGAASCPVRDVAFSGRSLRIAMDDGTVRVVEW